MKRVLSLVLALVLVLGMIPTFAADMTGGQHLYEHEFIAGDGMGNLNEDQLLTREQLAKLVLELNGSKEEAEALTLPPSYTDSAKISAWARPYVAYAQIEGLMKGYTDNTFRPQVGVSGQQLAQVLTRALGYEFSWETVIADAADLGIEVATDATLTRGQAFEAMWVTVNTVPKDEELALGVLLGKLEDPTPAPLAVESVTATNLKQFVVTFNGEVNKTAAQTLANYKAYNAGSTTNLVTGGSAVVSADLKSVVVTLGGQFTNGTTAKVVVSNVIEYTNDAVKVVDSTIPTVVGVAVTGPNTVTVEYSEPVTSLSTAEFTVDSGNYIVSAANANGSNKVDVVVGVNFTEGEHSIKFKGTNIADYAGYKVIPTTTTFTVVKDTTAPTVTVKSATPTEIKLVFSKPVTNVTNANVAYRHTYNNASYQILGNAGTVTATSSTEVTIDFTASPIPLGATSFYVSYVSGSGTMIQDLWGNKLAATVLTLDITMDTTKPAVNEVKFVDASTLKVTFSEKVDQTTAETESNYVVKDSTGKAITVATATRGGTGNNEVTLAFAANALAGGSYTVEIKNVKDEALVKNIMEAYTTTLTITDTVKPTALAGKYVIDNATDVNNKTVTVYIPFNEVMDSASLVKANFLKEVNGAGGFVPLGTNDTITIAADGKSVTLVLNGGTTNWTAVDVLVGAVKDPAGNGLATFTAEMSVVGLTADAIAVEKVEAISRTQIRVTFNGRLSTISATGYSFVEYDATPTVYNNAISVASHTINSSNKSVVVFNLGTNLSYDVKSGGDKIALVVTSATGTKSFLGTQVTDLVAADTDLGPIGAGELLDKIAPVLSTVVVDSATQITLTFTEALEADTFANTLNGFTVAGADVELDTVVISGGVDATTVVLTGSGFDANTTVSYNAVAGLTDVAGNALASFADQGE